MEATIIDGRPCIKIGGYEHMITLKEAENLWRELFSVVREIHLERFRAIRNSHDTHRKLEQFKDY